MPCAEPKVAKVQQNTRETKKIVKLEKTLTCTGKLTSSVARRLGELCGDVRSRPGAGFIEVGHQPMIDTAAAIAAFPS